MYDDNNFIQMDSPKKSTVTHSPKDLAIRGQLYKLQEQTETLEKIISEPQVIAIKGVQHLKPETGNTCKEKLTALLFDARIPFFWTIDLEENETDPNLAYIYFINNATKTKTKELLTHFIQTAYQNKVCIV